MFSPRLRPLKGYERSNSSCKMNHIYIVQSTTYICKYSTLCISSGCFLSFLLHKVSSLLEKLQDFGQTDRQIDRSLYIVYQKRELRMQSNSSTYSLQRDDIFFCHFLSIDGIQHIFLNQFLNTLHCHHTTSVVGQRNI